MVEKEFNDNSKYLNLDLRVSVDDTSIDVLAVPLAYRTGTKLNDIVFQTRGLFTTAHVSKNCSASGQNDSGIDRLSYCRQNDC